eukprot:2801129-Rhodomonas_salina.1
MRQKQAQLMLCSVLGSASLAREGVPSGVEREDAGDDALCRQPPVLAPGSSIRYVCTGNRIEPYAMSVSRIAPYALSVPRTA